ncbi:thiamine transporter 1 [Teleopsis dalmanni]|uniref:thiamine transporter 1 n=1 Tax=Teleopsis dalmanni TaxID=139649 RepID=UPI0018CEF877|nr:thiamine transporter 1 [Teleopsis dalmanni]XP_037945016.1 thiamine transporter 1 [Teleopsis dalmanni]
MKEWLKISCLLCVFGFIRELRPSEPYITEFLLGEWRNVTQDQVNREVYPVGTYSYLAQQVIVFLITDFLRYKPLIITIGVTGIIIWSMLIWTTSLEALQILEFFYGTYMASEVAYYTYIYAKVDKKYYPRVTSHTRAAMFAGKLVAGISAQLLINFELMNYKELNYITLATQIIATVWAFGLPKVERSLYFHRKEEKIEDKIKSVTDNYDNYSNSIDSRELEDTKSQGSNISERQSLISPTRLLWQHFYNAYTNIKVLQWSLWYAMGFCGYFQVISYVQVLWKDIEPEPSIAWNGAVDAVLTAFAALTALAAGYIHAGRFKPRASLLLLALLSALEGGAILMCCLTQNIYISYVGFIIFGVLYAFTITVASAEVARYLEEDSYGLVFGINTFIALLLQTILTIVVVSESGFALSAKGQYTVYGTYFITVGIIYFVSVIVEFGLSINKQKSDNELL